MPSKFHFEFDQTEPIFFTGQAISGRAILTSASEKNARGVYIRLVGWCFVTWTDYGLCRENSHYYLNKCMDVRNPVRGGGLLSIGTHNFIFSITIPKGPSSCEKEYGKIFYELSLVIDRIRNSNNIYCQAITVLESYNLNLHPSLALPIKKEKVNKTNCWCIPSSPIIVTLSLPFGGYAPGQSINYTLGINNQVTNCHTYDYKINVHLYEICGYKARFIGCKRRRNNIEIVKHRLTPMTMAKRSVTGSVTIPPLPPTSRYKCHLMIKYFLNVGISSKRNFNVKIPIEIGTSPIVSNEHSDVKPYAFEYSRSKGFRRAFINFFERYPCGRNDNFKPLYPMYRNT